MRMQTLGAGLVAPRQSALTPFVLCRPRTVAEVLVELERHPGAVIAAGCSDLVARFREDCAPGVLISLRQVAELRTSSHADGVLRIGALLTHDQGRSDRVVSHALPALASAWGKIATVRIRFRGTLGGNLMARQFRYEMPVILDSLDAGMVLADSHGERTLPVGSLWEDAAPFGLLTRAEIDTDSLIWFGYERSMRPLSTVALTIRRGAADELVVTAVCGSEYRRPYRLVHAARDAVVHNLDPTAVSTHLAQQLPDNAGDYNGSVGYRRQLVTVIASRLLTEFKQASEMRSAP